MKHLNLKISQWSPVLIALYIVIATFGIYFCMYAYRRPFAVGTFENYSLWGINYKVILIISQILGYMLSKFIGIKVIAEVKPKHRIYYILGFIGFAELALLGFGLVPVPYNFVFMFLNGIPLGMIWGLVYSYVEGRNYTELIAAGLSASFIVSSGIVKSIGLWLMKTFQVTEFWMPFLTGALFVIPLLLLVMMAQKIPAPSNADITSRNKRESMDHHERKKFFIRFILVIVPLLFFMVLIYGFRDFRDNFAVEIWDAIAPGSDASVLSKSEVPAAIITLFVYSLLVFVKNNRLAFLLNHVMVLIGILSIGIFTLFFQYKMISPMVWMAALGGGLYLSMVPWGTFFFERMFKILDIKGNCGFIIYLFDAIGYLGSVSILLFQQFFLKEVSWIDLFIQFSYLIFVIGTMLIIYSVFYFRKEISSNKIKINLRKIRLNYANSR